MYPVCNPAELEKVNSVATAVGLLRGGQFVHAAIVYRSSNGKPYFLHICSSGQVLNEESSNTLKKFAWSVPKLPSMVLKDIAAFCESMGNRPPKLAYRFKHTIDTVLVSKGDTFTLKGRSSGFTCATFVLAFFQTFNKPLLDLETWEHRGEDDDWIKQLVEMFENDKRAYGLTPKDIEELKSELPCVRFRPQEVVASCRASSHPTPFEEAETAGESLEKWLRSKS